VLRFIGAAVIAVCGGALGLYFSAALKKRLLLITELEGALNIVREELSANLTPLPELFAMASRQNTGPVSEFFGSVVLGFDEIAEKPFYDTWQEAANALPCLTPSEKDTLCRLGRTLGRYNTEDQVQTLGTVAARFAEFRRGAETRLSKEGKSRTVLGLASGILLAIILL
jgi:stage III sporulation protein AB